MYFVVFFLLYGLQSRDKNKQYRFILQTFSNTLSFHREEYYSPKILLILFALKVFFVQSFVTDFSLVIQAFCSKQSLQPLIFVVMYPN